MFNFVGGHPIYYLSTSSYSYSFPPHLIRECYLVVSPGSTRPPASEELMLWRALWPPWRALWPPCSADTAPRCTWPCSARGRGGRSPLCRSGRRGRSASSPFLPLLPLLLRMLRWHYTALHSAVLSLQISIWSSVICSTKRGLARSPSPHLSALPSRPPRRRPLARPRRHRVTVSSPAVCSCSACPRGSPATRPPQTEAVSRPTPPPPASTATPTGLQALSRCQPAHCNACMAPPCTLPCRLLLLRLPAVAVAPPAAGRLGTPLCCCWRSVDLASPGPRPGTHRSMPHQAKLKHRSSRQSDSSQKLIEKKIKMYFYGCPLKEHS